MLPHVPAGLTERMDGFRSAAIASGLVVAAVTLPVLLAVRLAKVAQESVLLPFLQPTLEVVAAPQRCPPVWVAAKTVLRHSFLPILEVGELQHPTACAD